MDFIRVYSATGTEIVLNKDNVLFFEETCNEVNRNRQELVLVHFVNGTKMYIRQRFSDLEEQVRPEDLRTPLPVENWD